MLRFLQIENFKSLKKVAIPIEKLNLFFGMNGMGKGCRRRQLEYVQDY